MSLFNIFGSANADSPHYWGEYSDSCRQISLKQTWREVTFLIFDTETSGLDPSKDNLLSIGGCELSNQSIAISSTFEYYKRGNYYPDEKSFSIHQIMPDLVENGLEEKDILARFITAAKGKIIVAHHLAFDLAIVNRLIQKHYPKLKIMNPALDTAILAQRLDHGQFMDSSNVKRQDYGLDQLLDRYGLPKEERHTASGDALATAFLLQKLLFAWDEDSRKPIGELPIS
ncbi:MAG: 3'-5' exonuclease [Cyclobacteriaceae bacterium]|nr:3'-5' exonuclease [Cyclobacteriaceae bacterium]MCH8517306.1 3'-5' exonuclease [Cyclobacteriaceae bacterium]